MNSISFFASSIVLFLQVQHSRTSPSSYENDFLDLIDMYTGKRGIGEMKQMIISEEVNEVLGSSSNSSMSEADCISENYLDNIEDGNSDRYDEANSFQENGLSASKGRELSVEYLENDVDIFQNVNDWDGKFIVVSCDCCAMTLTYL